MTGPSSKIREATYDRDGRRCVSCGTRYGIQYQHRHPEGMGGSLIPPTMPDGLTSCAICNPGYESHLQRQALKFGWKVKWVRDRSKVPVYYPMERKWYVLSLLGRRVQIPPSQALQLMREAYGEAWDDELGVVA